MQVIDLRSDRLSSGQVRRRGDLEFGLIRVVEEGEELVVVALSDRVVLVVVALGAADRQAEKDGARGVDAVDDRLDPELLDVDPPFLVDLRIAVEPGGDPRGERGFRRRSPAIWSIVNWSNGMSALKASMTQSRYFQIERGRRCCNHWNRHSEPGRARGVPTARRNAARPAGDRRHAHKHSPTDRPERRRLPRATGAARSGRDSARRSKVARSASAEGGTPARSRRARMKRSIVFRAQRGSRHRGR